MVRYFQNGEQIFEIRFPITDMGKSSDITIVLENEFAEDGELIPVTHDPDLQIIEHPRRILSMEKGIRTVWRFSPSKDRLQEGKKISLDSEAGFRVLYGR